MRGMNLPSFPERVQTTNLEFLLKTRLSTTVVMWPDQAIPLLGYMCHPKDCAAWQKVVKLLWSWFDGAGPNPALLPENLNRIQANWRKVTDIFQNYCDLMEGQHQKRRGGASIGKAVTLVSANAQSRGTANANLWKVWGDYKDVAHLVTAATVISREVRGRFRNYPPTPTGLSPTQFVPFQMALLMPDLVVAVAKSFVAKGLIVVNDSRRKPALDPETFWRIPDDINVEPLPHPIRPLSTSDIGVLNERRAGKRGRVDKTTPVSE